jgi:hypothetical protein
MPQKRNKLPLVNIEVEVADDDGLPAVGSGKALPQLEQLDISGHVG